MLRAKKSFGQNFLVDKNIIERIVSSIGLTSKDTLIEIGPGMGALTDRLVEQADRIVAIELDRDLVPLLRARFANAGHVTIIEGDALTMDLCAAIAPANSARLVANLPYYISTAILQRLIDQRRCLNELVIMLQREVADRITAEPSTHDRGYLSVLVQAYAEIEKLFDVAPTAFSPVPKVWSTVVRIRLRNEIAVDIKDEKLFLRIVSAGFAQRRKTILNNLRNSQDQVLNKYILEIGGIERVFESSGVESRRRAESFDLEEWARIANAIEN